ncbi:unnamed protein product [Rhizoctonia solani]|uniref:Uncharacterized protein n=1 Tax=Rhizoctonia solani TaxID=456999 RepID=A0A8H3GNL5_9AGAM|nr:unnamed protein product [Rhizoctonia solani]
MKRTTPNSPAKNPKPSKLRSTVGGLSAAESRATDGPPPAPTVLSKAVNLQQHTPDVSMLNPDDPDWEDEDVVEIPETDFDDGSDASLCCASTCSNSILAKRSRARQNASQNVDEYETDSDNGDVPPPAMKKLTRSRARKNAKNVDNDTSENEIDPGDASDAPSETEKPKRGRARKNADKDTGKSAAGQATRNTGISKKKTKNAAKDADEDDEDEDDVADSLVTKPKTVILKIGAFKDARVLTESFMNQLCQALKISIINARVKESARMAKGKQYQLRSKYLKDLQKYEEAQDPIGLVVYQKVLLEEARSRRLAKELQLSNLGKDNMELRCRLERYEKPSNQLSNDLLSAQKAALNVEKEHLL